MWWTQRNRGGMSVISLLSGWAIAADELPTAIWKLVYGCVDHEIMVKRYEAQQKNKINE